MAVFRKPRSEYQIPSAVRQRFALQHSELTADGIQTVEAAARQWLRLVDRRPKAKLAMPSVLVEDFCRELVLHDQRIKPLTSDGGLPATLRLARQDEDLPLPLLFRVDQELGAAGGRRYLADCGGRGVCYELKGTICLQHLSGAGKRPGSGRWEFERRSDQPGSIYDGSGASCGGGCGGGN